MSNEKCNCYQEMKPGMAIPCKKIHPVLICAICSKPIDMEKFNGR